MVLLTLLHLKSSCKSIQAVANYQNVCKIGTKPTKAKGSFKFTCKKQLGTSRYAVSILLCASHSAEYWGCNWVNCGKS